MQSNAEQIIAFACVTHILMLSFAAQLHPIGCCGYMFVLTELMTEYEIRVSNGSLLLR